MNSAAFYYLICALVINAICIAVRFLMFVSDYEFERPTQRRAEHAIYMAISAVVLIWLLFALGLTLDFTEVKQHG